MWVAAVAIGLSTHNGTGGIRPSARSFTSRCNSSCTRPTANAGTNTTPPRAAVRPTTSIRAASGSVVGWVRSPYVDSTTR